MTRFRAELQAGAPQEQAVVTAMRTAGRAVLTAGTTVVVGMLQLLVLRQALLNGVARGPGDPSPGPVRSKVRASRREERHGGRA